MGGDQLNLPKLLPGASGEQDFQGGKTGSYNQPIEDLKSLLADKPASASRPYTMEDLDKLRSSGPIADACQPDFTVRGGEMTVTPKREQYDALARLAINGPVDKSVGPASRTEQDIARKVVQFGLKAQKDLASYPENKSLLEDHEGLREIFAKLGSHSAQRVINEANISLEASGVRIAQSKAGEIWMGYKSTDGVHYSSSTELKKAKCKQP